MQSQRLADLETELQQADICPELRDSATQLVMGHGNPDADIVFVGEAPGKNEDLQGRPFVGASGRFLDEMLSSVGMNRDDIYITNIVKYRPPNNRDPLPVEKDAFWPYLVAQLAIINPKVIITLGRHSGLCFLPDLQISQDHGKAHDVQIEGHNYLVIPLYHPAAALYNGSMRQVLTDDFVGAATRASQ